MLVVDQSAVILLGLVCCIWTFIVACILLVMKVSGRGITYKESE